jgi:hypothetical protein
MKKTVKTIKKMSKGGEGGCPPGQCPEYEGGTRVGCKRCRAGIIAGLTTSITGAGAVVGKMIGDKIKSVNEKQKAAKLVKAAEKAAQNTPTAKFKKGLEGKLKTQKRGGSVKSKKK